jgi:Kef-type K+ transport system membrane component KefB
MQDLLIYIARWLATLILAWGAGKLISKLRMPAILGWLIAGMALGPFGLKLLPQSLLSTSWYQTLITWMQCAFGLMLGTELVWKRLRNYGKALVVTTLTQSLGTFLFVSLTFGIALALIQQPVWLALAFGGIALATAPAPALSIVQEFHTRGPVTETLLPMAVLDDVVAIAVFFTVNSFITRQVSGGSMPLYMIPVMILLPILIGILPGLLVGLLLHKNPGKVPTLLLLLAGITLTTILGITAQKLLPQASLNFMLMGVSYSAVFSNMISEDQLNLTTQRFQPILSICLLTTIVDLGAPLDYHLIIGAGVFTLIYIVSRALGKYFGSRIGAKATRMPQSVQKYLGLTLLPHSGVSLVFTGIVSSALAGPEPELALHVKGTIAAAAVINEILAVLLAKKGFELAGEIKA